MLLFHEVARATNYMTVYKDSDDPRLFYYIPQFAEISKRNDGKLAFGAVFFEKNPNDPNDGFSLYNFGVRGVYPSAELAAVKSELEAQYGGPVALQPVNPSVATPSLHPITDGIYRSIKCQLNGGNLYTDLAASFTVDESLEPELSKLMKSGGVGWAGSIMYKVLTKRTVFKFKIVANWHRVLEHFRAQVSIKYWFVSANLSYETQKLIQNGTISITVDGGTPSEREKVTSLAEKIAGRLFVPTLQENPMPGHPTGSALCLSVNYSKIEEDKTETWTGEYNDYEEKELGMAAYVRDIPDEYFVNFDKAKHFINDLDSPDTHQQYEKPLLDPKKKETARTARS
ncbi:hypothetical protein [Taklimakanibacter lacteus]|uniref:hypothetical protein n=1 Tax=Taklimakanibacter lacteus TaxID=2268456 RepID=UPI0013C535B7